MVELPPLPQAMQDIVIVKSADACSEPLKILRKVRGQEKRVFAVNCQLYRQKEDSQLVCFSIYCGKDIDFGGGHVLWVDTTAVSKESLSTLICFKEFFEDERYKKVYHNFSIMNHALLHHHISHSGFAGDTMHMARIWDASLEFLQDEGDSLLQLVGRCLGSTYKRALASPEIRKSDGKFMQRPLELQSRAETRSHWIKFSSCEAVCVFHLGRDLEARLRAMDCRPTSGAAAESMWDFYVDHWRPFGELLGEMERTGMGVDVEYLGELEASLASDRAALEAAVRRWATDATSEHHGPSSVEGANLHALNICSDAQVRQLLFGGEANRDPGKGGLPEERLLPGSAAITEEAEPAAHMGSGALQGASQLAPVSDGGVAAADYRNRKVDDLKDMLRSRGLIVSGRKADLVERLQLHDQGVEQKKAPSAKPKGLKVRIRGLKLGLEPASYTAAGWPSVSADALRTMGKGLSNNEQGALGAASVRSALEKIVEIKGIDGTIDGFIRPLRGHARNGRIHSSYNLNTETGRLSSRDPNLQNQPSGRSQVRKAFVAGEENALVVADYSQLELRVLAHMAGCTPMVDVLNSGGDFHSRTAAEMFPHVKDAVKQGRVRLDEEDGSSGQSLPSVKETFSLERVRAKVLNFSILYGKTPWGLSQDWGISEAEATANIGRWYRAYPEIRQWQDLMEDEVKRSGAVRTILGRPRKIPLIRSKFQYERKRALRAAINTPVQGSAADIVTCAMQKLASSTKLHELRFRMVNQVHDEVILEGPEVHAHAALEEVLKVMEDPLPFPLDAKLVVSAHTGKNWFDAKPD